LGFVARPLNIARCRASFKVTDGHRLVGLTLGFTFITGGYARQVWQFGPALIFVLTFIFPSKWMTRAVAKGCAGKRALTRLKHN